MISKKNRYKGCLVGDALGAHEYKKKRKLIDVFNHTKELFLEQVPPLSEKVNWDKDFGKLTSKKEGLTNKIIVEPIDSVSALLKFSTKGEKICILNMASAKRKGGGVENGAQAQEECLFRCSNLFTIPDEFYPLNDNELIYTHKASFIKNYKYMEIPVIECDVITIPAINTNNTETYYTPLDYFITTKCKIINMLNMALLNNCSTIILGAWGCGVFKNDPKTIATLFKEILEDEKYKEFNNIIFPIINDKNSVGSNFEIFRDILAI